MWGFIVVEYLCYIILDKKTHSHTGSVAFSLEEGRIAPLPLPRHVIRGDYLECLAK